jgi:hypothetical protein
MVGFRFIPDLRYQRTENTERPLVQSNHSGPFRSQSTYRDKKITVQEARKTIGMWVAKKERVAHLVLQR